MTTPPNFKFMINCWLTHSLTHSRSWALLQKLSIVQLLKNFPAFYGIRRFITVLTRALHWSLSWARSIQSIPSFPINLRSILILSTHLRHGFTSGLFPSGVLTNIFPPFRATCPAPGPRLFEHIRKKLNFYSEELLALRPTPKLEDHPLSAVRDCLFNIFAATLHTWRPSPSATWGRAVPWWQGTHLTLIANCIISSDVRNSSEYE
jgi:hypothetical protein